MFFQIKAIRKGSKPAIWRRAYIPSNITFAQLALLLEIILEYDESDMYEFEFFQKKDRMIEWHEGDQNLHDFYYSYLNAPDTYINEWLMNKEWFTFRMRKTGPDVPEYRVETEKVLKSIQFQDDGNRELSYPVIFKEVSVKNDRFWSDLNVINETLKNKYFTRKTDADYMYISELRTCIREGQGIAVCDEMINRDIHTKKSANSALKELTDNILSPFIFQKMEELKKEIDHDANKRITASVEEILNAYTKQNLCEMAKDLGLELAAARKDKIVYELASHLLDPQIMREQLLQVDDSELDAFEKAMEKGCFEPSEEEFQELAAVCDLNYIADFTDNTMEVPEEVILVYNVIKKNGYREFHKKAYWLLICLKAFDLIHVVAPDKILYRMYRQNINADYEDFMAVLYRIPDSLNPCRMIGNRIVSKDTIKNEIYKRIEAGQRDIDYYIPTVKEIISYAEDGYPSCEDAYAALFDFYHGSMHVDDELCEYLCLHAFCVFSSGGMLSDYMDIVNEKDVTFDSDKQVERFAFLAMQVNNNTRMFELKGHKPLEMRMGMSDLPNGKKPTIVPMSGLAAQMLESGKSQLAAMGIDIDTKSTGTDIPVIHYKGGLNGKAETSMKKVYPNDLCPCGSGLKYKRCCGRR